MIDLKKPAKEGSDMFSDAEANALIAGSDMKIAVDTSNAARVVLNQFIKSDPDGTGKNYIAFIKKTFEDCIYKEGDDKDAVRAKALHFMSLISKEFLRQSRESANILAPGLMKSSERTSKMAKAVLKQVFAEIGHAKLHDFFKSLQEVEMLDAFIEDAQSRKSFLPVSIMLAAIKWRKQNHLTVNTESDAQDTLEILKAEGSAPESILGVQVVEVDDLLPDGESEDEKLPGSRARRSDEENPNKRTQPRLSWVIAALENDGFEKDSMRILKDREVESLGSKTSPYIVLEAKKDNQSVQIALCPVIGNATYVIRNHIDFQNGPVTTIADLKKDPSVFQFNCYSETQWIRDIRHYAFTPLEKLPIQLKKRIAWADKKRAVEDSFGQFVLEFEQTPFTVDRSAIRHGALADQTTWSRLYYALFKQSIAGLEHVRTFSELKEHIFGSADVSAPKPDEAPVLEFNAQEEFHRAVLHIRDTKALPEQDDEFARSLKAGKVSGLDAIIGDDAELITSKHEFLMCAGLAEEKNGKLVPASPVLINQLARVLINGAPRPELN